MPPEILIAGAGPVGLAAAIRLDALGYHASIVAPAPARSDHRTAAMLAGSVDFLDQLGVWSRVADQAAPLRSMRIVDATRRLIRAPEVIFHASEIGLPAFGYNIANATLTAGLESLCEERRIERRHTSVTGITFDDDAIVAELEDGDSVSARLCVAADGRNSGVRKAVGIRTVDWSYDQSALVCNFDHSLPHFDTSTEFHTENGPFTLVPLPGQRSSLVWVTRPAEAKRLLSLTSTDLSGEIEVRSASLLGRIAVDGAAQVFPLAGMGAVSFAAHRAVLAGEAAHLFPPIGAQGLNLGYRDLSALAETLEGPLADPGHDSVLGAYNRARRPDVYGRTTAVDALNRTLLSGILPAQALRGLGLFLLDRVPQLRRAVMRKGVAQVD